ncbi:MAG: response regulator [Vicinamibacterales bacterium]|nr:response regulator [Vicinamibacterales bacterium]
MQSAIQALFVEDSEDDCFLIARELTRAGLVLEWQRVETEPQFRDALARQTWDVVLSDHSMPHFSSLDALRIVREHEPGMPFVIVSGTIGEERAVAAMRAGASDYVLKGNLTRLPQVVVRELREAENRRRQWNAEVALRESQEQLQHAQKMEAMGRLAGGIAHDFNNLLTAILGFSELALDSLTHQDPLRRDLDQIVLAAERASRLTSQLLAFCRREPHRPTAVNLNEMVRLLVPMLQRLIGADIDVVSEPDPSMPTIVVDQGQLEQVLMNLAVNARDAMPDGGTLTITTRAVQLDAASAAPLGIRAGDYGMIAVGDTGHGMDEMTRARVFEPFFTTKDSGKGTGLGLSTVFGIVQQSGGAVDLKTATGEGTTFTLYFPRPDDARTTEDASEERAGTRTGTEAVLIVENDPIVRRMAVAVLGNAGYTVLEATSGEDASRLAQTADHVHLLVTNLVMPGGTGRDLARRLSARHPALRVLYLSGYASHDAMPADLLANPGALLRKPFRPSGLLTAVRARLDATDGRVP